MGSLIHLLQSVHHRNPVSRKCVISDDFFANMMEFYGTFCPERSSLSIVAVLIANTAAVTSNHAIRTVFQRGKIFTSLTVRFNVCHLPQPASRMTLHPNPIPRHRRACVYSCPAVVSSKMTPWKL